MVRFIGFSALVILLSVVAWGLVHAIALRDWKGMAIMAGFFGLLVGLGYMLWLGRRAERDAATPLATGWSGQPVSAFLRGPVLQSTEGRIALVGAAVSLLAAVVSAFWPGLLPYRRPPSELAGLFGMWPVLSFLYYMNICGPDYASSIGRSAAMLAGAAAPFVIAGL